MGATNPRAPSSRTRHDSDTRRDRERSALVSARSGTRPNNAEIFVWLAKGGTTGRAAPGSGAPVPSI
jgi:hypothetical protein